MKFKNECESSIHFEEKITMKLLLLIVQLEHGHYKVLNYFSTLVRYQSHL